MPEKRCPKCDGLLSRRVNACPHCGEKVSKGSGTWIGLTIGLLVLAGIVFLVVKNSISQIGALLAPSKTVVVQSQPPPPAPKPVVKPPEPTPAALPPKPAPSKPAPPPKPQLAKGMTEDQVRQILGTPSKPPRSAIAPNLQVDYWDYDSGQELKFVNGRLETWTEGGRETPLLTEGTESASAAKPVTGSVRERQIYGELRAVIKSGELHSGSAIQDPMIRAAMVADATQGVRMRYHLSMQQQQILLNMGDKEHWPVPNLLMTGRGQPPTLGAAYVTGEPLVLVARPIVPGVGRQPHFDVPAGTPVRVATAQAPQGTRHVWYQLVPAQHITVPWAGGWIADMNVVPCSPEPAQGAESAGSN